MASVRAWRLLVAARLLPRAVPRAASASAPKDRPVIGRLKRRAEVLQVAAANRKRGAPGFILQVCRHSRSETVNATPKGGADLLRVDDAASPIAATAIAADTA